VLHFFGVTVDDTSATPDGSWWGWRQAMRVVLHPAHLKRTAATALVVGTILFAINQLNVVIDGQATAVTWIKTGVTYLVPFAVANVGILIATRRSDDRQPGRGGHPGAV
jgi:hypothetical protein